MNDNKKEVNDLETFRGEETNIENEQVSKKKNGFKESDASIKKDSLIEATSPTIDENENVEDDEFIKNKDSLKENSIPLESSVEEQSAVSLTEGELHIEENVKKDNDFFPNEIEENPVIQPILDAETEEVLSLKSGLPDIEIENNSEDGMTEDLTMKMPPVKPLEKDAPKIETKKQTKKGLIIATIIIGLILIIAIVYFLLNNSKNMFLAAINKEYGNIIQTVSKNQGISKYHEAKDSTITTGGNFSFHIEANQIIFGEQVAGIIGEINKIDGSYNIGTDYKNKNIIGTLGLNYNKQSMLEVGAYGTQKNLYIELKELLDSYINIPIDNYDTLFEDPALKVEDAKSISKIVKNAFLDSLDAKDFKKENVNTKIGNDSKKTNKISYTITEKNIHKVYEKFLEKLKKNNDFIKLVTSYTEQTEKELISEIEKQIKTSKNQKIMGTEEIILSVYMEGIVNKAIKYEITTVTKETYKNEETVFAYAKAKEATYITVEKNQKSVLVLKHEKINNDKSKTVITMDGFTMTIDGVKQAENYTYSYQIKDTGTGKIIGKLSLNKQKKDKDYIGKDTFTLNYEIDGSSILKIDGSNQYKTTIGDKVNIPTNLEKNIKWNELTEKDQNTIMNNLMKNKSFVEFMTTISAYIE